MHSSPSASAAGAVARLVRSLATAGIAAAALVIAVSAGPPRLATANATALAAAAHDFTEPVFSADARGDIVTIGNVTTTCDPTYANDRWSAAESAAACTGATSGGTGLARYDGAPMPPINNRLSMQFVDADRDPATFASSLARLDIPATATVLWAGLHWNAATDVPSADQLYGSTYEVAPPSTAKRFQVRFATPASGGYVDLDAAASGDTWNDTNPGGTVSYGGYVDVTDLVRAGGAGTYAAADVQSCRGFGGCFGSWSLTVAIADPSMPPRNLNVWHGWHLTTPTVDAGAQQFTVNGITPPPRGPVHARIGVVQADGDRGLGPDSLDISSPSSPTWKPFSTIDRPLNASEGDWFNSTVNAYGERRAPGAATPDLLANLDQDIALVDDGSVIANDDHSFSFRVQTAGSESLYSQVVHSAVDLYEPEIAIAKEVTPASDLHAGDTVTWTVKVSNAGIDPIRHTVVTDPLPTGITYVPGSVRYTAGGPASILGPKTDAAGDDPVDWDASKRTLTFRVGAGADGTAGGTMGIAPAADGSHQLTLTYRTKVDLGPDASLTNVAHARGEGREMDDPFGPLTTEAHDPAAITSAPQADLGITKTDGDAVVRAVGDRFTYELVATNAGPSAATGVTMTDDLDPMLRFVDSDDGCTAAGQRVTCPVGSLADGATATRDLVVEVVHLPGPGHHIPNTAVITGNEPNPDCTGTTPGALCNHDDEETPQPEIDLGITKTDDDAVVGAVGDTYAYRLAVTNAGPDTATGVVITDDLDPMIAFASSDSCTADGQQVRCEVGQLDAGESATAELTVAVVSLPEPGETIPNVATVHATEPDPDCSRETPTARCNHDGEETPRAEAATTTTTTTATAAPTTTTPARVLDHTPSAPLVRTGAQLAGLVGLGTAAIAAGVGLLAARRRAAAR